MRSLSIGKKVEMRVGWVLEDQKSKPTCSYRQPEVSERWHDIKVHRETNKERI